MKITVRGWARDMGSKELANIHLGELTAARDGTAYRNRPTLFSSWEGPMVAWCQAMRYIGDYRMDIQFSRQDILQLLRLGFGRELPAALIEEHGFVASPELKKAILEDIDFLDLTIRDLMSRPFGIDPVMFKRVDELELSVRSANCLKNDNIIYVGDLVQKTEAEMLRTPNFGRRSLNEIKDALAQMSLHLGRDVPGWPPKDIERLAKLYEDPIERAT